MGKSSQNQIPLESYYPAPIFIFFPKTKLKTLTFGPGPLFIFFPKNKLKTLTLTFKPSRYSLRADNSAVPATTIDLDVTYFKFTMPSTHLQRGTNTTRHQTISEREREVGYLCVNLLIFILKKKRKTQTLCCPHPN